MKLALPISRNLQVLDPTRRSDQIAGVGPVAIAFALGTALTPRSSNEGIELLAHYQFDHCAHGTLGQGTQMLMEFLLLGQRVG